MTEHPHRTLMRRATEAFARGDVEALQQIFAPDAVWHVPGRSRVSGTYTGHAEVFGFFGKLMELSGGTFKLELHDILASDEHAVNLDRMTASHNGKTLDGNIVLVTHIRDGRIAEGWDFFSDQYAWDEFFS